METAIKNCKNSVLAIATITMSFAVIGCHHKQVTASKVPAPPSETAFAPVATLKTSAPSLNASVQYPNTRDGLYQFLTNCIAAAKSGNQSQVDADVKSMEIPDYANWFRETWPGPGESWIGPYGKTLQGNESSMKNLLTYLAHQDGTFIVRKVNDSPEPGKGMEWGMLHAAARPVDLYYAGWKHDTEHPVHGRDVPIGYFYFINGGFRWDSLVRFFSINKR
jgi:hypothetical protein